jgi:hypothetical protein
MSSHVLCELLVSWARPLAILNMSTPGIIETTEAKPTAAKGIRHRRETGAITKPTMRQATNAAVAALTPKPSREKGCKACQQQLVGHFLQSDLRASIAKFRLFPANYRQSQADFFALQTVWRREQSRANSSPLEFPANREKYRQFARFWSQISTCFFLSTTICWRKRSASAEMEQGINRGVSGN